VHSAGTGLRNALDAEPERRRRAIERLEQAAAAQDTAVRDFQAFMFEQLEPAAEVDVERRAAAAEETLASVLADLDVGNVLVAAGRAVGEGQPGAATDAASLNDALRRLDNTKNTLAGDGRAGAATFGFTTRAAPAPALHSADLAAAIATFSARSDAALQTLVDESAAALTKALHTLLSLGSVGEALTKLGEPLGELPKVGRLIGLGVRKLRRAFATLANLLGHEAVRQVKGKVDDLWKKVTSGEALAALLRTAFDVETTRQSIATILSGSVEHDRVDGASAEIDALVERYKGTMGLVGAISSAIAFTAGVLAFVPGAGTSFTLALALAELLVVASVLLIGMDYADSGRVLRRVRGVGDIAQGVVTVQA
jgi:hypothetical protein